MPSFPRHACRLAFAAAALAGAGGALAAPYPGETLMRAAIAEAANIVRAEGLQVEALDAIREGVRQPLTAAGIHQTGTHVPEEAAAVAAVAAVVAGDRLFNAAIRSPLDSSASAATRR